MTRPYNEPRCRARPPHSLSWDLYKELCHPQHNFVPCIVHYQLC